MINEMIWEVQRVGLAAKTKAKIDCTAAFSMGYALFDDTLREPSEPPGSRLSTLHVVAAMCTSSKRLVSPDDTRFMTDSVYGDLIPVTTKRDQGIVIKDGVECPTEYTRMDDTWSKLQIYHYVIPTSIT